MNIRAIANMAVQRVHSNATIMWSKSLGYTIDDDGIQEPAYAEQTAIQADVQGLSVSDIRAYEGLNITTASRKVYIAEQPNGNSRPDVQGGDLFVFPAVTGGDDRTWLVTAVLESWPDWSCVLVTMQNDS